MGPLQNLVGAKMGLKIEQVVPNNSTKESVHLTFGDPGTDFLPKSIRIDVLKVFCSCMIDLGPRFCNLSKLIDGVAIGLGIFLNRILQTVILKLYS